jgi:predicted GNAT family N-acyltransferase
MSVLRDYRGKGVGSAILNALVAQARLAGFEEVILHAQTHAINFYVRHAFLEEGELFYEANIPHKRMRRSLKD